MSGVPASLVVGTDLQDMPSGTTKYAAAATGFSPPAGSLSYAIYTFNASPSTQSVGSGYTAGYNSVANPLGLSQYQEFATLQTNHRPEMTVGTAFRVGPACCLYVEAGGGGGGGTPVAVLANHYNKVRRA